MKEIFHFLSHFKKMLIVRFFLLKIYYNLGQLYRVGNQCKFGSRIVLNIQVCLSLVLLKAILIWLSYEALRMHSLNARVDPELIIFLINLLKLHFGSGLCNLSIFFLFPLLLNVWQPLVTAMSPCCDDDITLVMSWSHVINFLYYVPSDSLSCRLLTCLSQMRNVEEIKYYRNVSSVILHDEK